MELKCPKCSRLLLPEHMNITTDVAQCIACNEVFKISSQVHAEFPNSFDANDAPSGAGFEKNLHGFTVFASTRSPIALFIVPFMMVWSGFSVGGIYGRQLTSGEFSLAESLFGIPFLLGTIIFGTFALMTVCGKVVVTVQHDNATIFVGIGRLGWRRACVWSEICEIREQPSATHYPGGYGHGIVLEGKKRIKFGTNLNENRRYFLLQALKYHHMMRT